MVTPGSHHGHTLSHPGNTWSHYGHTWITPGHTCRYQQQSLAGCTAEEAALPGAAEEGTRCHSFLLALPQVQTYRLVLGFQS